MEKVTIHEVARHAGVSIATVSRVLNRNSYVEPETAARVRRAIDDTGYFPDSMARGLRSRKTYAIGYVVSDISNLHFTVAAKAIEAELEAGGYNLIVCSTDGDSRKEEKQLRLLMSKKVDGLIINVSGKNDRLVCDLSRKIPIVLIARRVDNPDFAGDFVGNDNFRGAYELARHVLSFGHRRIGLIRGPDDLSTGSERFNGFTAALRDAGVTLPDELVFTGDFYEESGREGAQRLLAATPAPTLLVTMNNAMSFGALSYVKQRGLRIPEDLSFAAYGDIFNRELLYVNPTIVSQNPGKEGQLAGELLMRRIADKNATPMTALIPSSLLEGESIARIGG